MNNNFNMQLTKKLVSRYRKSNKIEKSQILKEYCQITQTSHNTAIKRLSRVNILPDFNSQITKLRKQRSKQTKSGKLQGLTINSRMKGAKKKYLPLHHLILEKCWEVSGHICGERLRPIIPDCIDSLKRNNKLAAYNEYDINLVKSMSEITIKRAIANFLKLSPEHRVKRHKTTKTGLYNQIPVKANFGEYASHGAGYIEIDYVEHNGGNAQGYFAITGNYTDVSSQWIVRYSSLGKSLQAVAAIHDNVSGKVRHKIKEYHPDNAPSILSLLFYRMTQDKDKVKQQQKKQDEYGLSRSRPYKKNDNAHVEQKNRDKIRKVVGHYRYDTQEEVDILNKLYEKLDLYDNFFIPSKKLISKVFNDKGKVIKKIYDKPKTPYQRLTEDETVDQETKMSLQELYLSLDMLQLREEIDELLDLLKNVISNKKLK